MKRNIAKLIRQYDESMPDVFYASDIQQIHDISKNEWETIVNSLRAGFMIGYKFGYLFRTQVKNNCSVSTENQA